MLTETMKEGKNKYKIIFTKSQKVTLVEKGVLKHYIKLTFLDGSTAVYDNEFNVVMSSYMEEKNGY